jgi:polysaccharide pyruvyl transferase WcaK-like protein
MPQLGIVTFHSSFNEGAILQALALSNHLSRLMPDWRVEIVDLYYEAKQKAYERVMTGREREMQEFIRTRLPLSAEKYVLGKDHDRLISSLKNNYQSLVYGSDEIWKTRYRRRLFGWGELVQDNPYFPAFPNAYWPHARLDLPQFAYAVCIGTTRRHLVPEGHRALMRESVSSLSLIGVRDNVTKRFVELLDPAFAARITKVPDPTFSVDVADESHAESARQKLTSWGVDFSRPTAAVLCWHNPRLQPTLQRLRSRGYQTVGLTLKNGFVDVDLSTRPLNPLEWMGAFRLFDVCLSERMHACISCLLQSTPVIALDFLKRTDLAGSKIEDLFDTFGLPAFHYSARLQKPSELVGILDRFEAGLWPAAHVRQVVETLRARSLDFGRQLVRSLEASHSYANGNGR